MSKISDWHASNDWPKERHQTHNDQPSMTRQEFKEECDINTLMAKYDGFVNTGPNGLRNPEQMFYADFTQMPGTLLEYAEFIEMADQQFMSLPAAVRKEFNNSAYEFVEFASDPENLPQMRTWGLAAPEPPPEKVQKVEVVQTTSAPPSASAPGGASPTHGST